MADEKRDVPRAFDVRTVEHLLKLMSEHDLSEVDLKDGDQRIRLRKGSMIPAGLLPPAVAYAPAPVSSMPLPTSGSVAAAPISSSAAPSNLVEIKSPTPGTFYSKPKPDKPDYVAVGSRVKPDTVVCLIEAMKLYNDIKAEVSGTIREICVKNGEGVEYNTVLFRVDPTA